MHDYIQRTELDPLFEDAARLVVDAQNCSTSLIQRHFSIGYNRSSQIIENLEEGGIIGPFALPHREVLCKTRDELDNILNCLNKFPHLKELEEFSILSQPGTSEVLKILNENLSVIARTDDLSVLNEKYNIAFECIEWIQENDVSAPLLKTYNRFCLYHYNDRHGRYAVRQIFSYSNN